MPSQAAFSTAAPLAARYKNKIEDGIKASARKWGVTLPNNIDLSNYDFQGKNTTRLKNRPIQPNTSLLYEKQFRQFWKYLAIRGDYDSMLMLVAPCPENVPSMKLSSVEEYPRFKRLTKGDPLMSTDKTTRLTDICGIEMTAEGSWKAPKNVEHFSAAITNIHAANSRSGSYTEYCDACLALAPDERHKGCTFHLGSPRLFNDGDPTESIEYKNTVTTLDKLANDDGYTEKGSSSLLPSDLRILRNNLMNSGTLHGLQTWTIIICAVKQAWRHDDYYDLEFDKMLPEHFEIRPDFISALAMEVNGKADQGWIQQKLHADNEYPELCPVRPLLIYMHVIGVQGGFLFPSDDELSHPPDDGIYKTTIDYQTFLDQFKRLSYRILPPRPGFKIGCQTFRKTFYCVAVFGGGEEADVQMSARHKSVEQANKYRKDVAQYYQTHLKYPNPANNVSKWKPIHILSDGGNAALMTAYAGFDMVPPSLVGSYYVQTILGIQESSPYYKNIAFLVNASMHRGANMVDPDDALNKFASENLPPDKVSQLQGLIGACVKKQVGNIVKHSNGDSTLATAVAPVPIPTVAVEEPPPKKIKAKAVKNDLSERHNLATLDSSREKIDVMVSLWNGRQAWGPLTPGAKSFKNKFLTPIMSCLANHFGGNVDDFLATYPDVQHTLFPSKCCGGVGNECSPK